MPPADLPLIPFLIDLLGPDRCRGPALDEAMARRVKGAGETCDKAPAVKARKSRSTTPTPNSLRCTQPGAADRADPRRGRPERRLQEAGERGARGLARPRYRGGDGRSASSAPWRRRAASSTGRSAGPSPRPRRHAGHHPYRSEAPRSVDGARPSAALSFRAPTRPGAGRRFQWPGACRLRSGGRGGGRPRRGTPPEAALRFANRAVDGLDRDGFGLVSALSRRSFCRN